MNKTKRNIFSVIFVLSIGIMGFVVWHFFQQTTLEDVMKMMVKDNKDAIISIVLYLICWKNIRFAIRCGFLPLFSTCLSGGADWIVGT